MHVLSRWTLSSTSQRGILRVEATRRSNADCVKVCLNRLGPTTRDFSSRRKWYVAKRDGQKAQTKGEQDNLHHFNSKICFIMEWNVDIFKSRLKTFLFSCLCMKSARCLLSRLLLVFIHFNYFIFFSLYAFTYF